MKNVLKYLLVAIAMGAAQLALAADVSGSWTMTVDTGNGTGNPSFVLTQKGEDITGTYKGQFGEAPVTGTIKGNDIALSVKVSAQGQSLEEKYTGTVNGNSMSGKVSFGEMGGGTFKGTKQ